MRFRRRVGDRKAAGRSYVQTRKIERFYSAQLRKIARHVGELIKGSPTGTVAEADRVATALGSYAKLIEPWAKATGERMLAEVSRSDRHAWRQRSAEMSRLLERELSTAPTGAAFRDILASQVDLITSIPREAGERVQGLVRESMVSGGRAAAIAEEIARSGEVAQSRAETIARTEVSTAASVLTEVRSQHAGSTGYIWRTAGDGDVRPSHAAMEGRFVAWASPPTLDGMKGHAGRFPNCRCYPEPVLPKFD